MSNGGGQIKIQVWRSWTDEAKGYSIAIVLILERLKYFPK
jgi:hypothetical protein